METFRVLEESEIHTGGHHGQRMIVLRNEMSLTLTITATSSIGERVMARISRSYSLKFGATGLGLLFSRTITPILCNRKSGAGLWETQGRLRIVVKAQILYHPELSGVDPCKEKLVYIQTASQGYEYNSVVFTLPSEEKGAGGKFTSLTLVSILGLFNKPIKLKIQNEPLSREKDKYQKSSPKSYKHDSMLKLEVPEIALRVNGGGYNVRFVALENSLSTCVPHSIFRLLVQRPTCFAERTRRAVFERGLTSFQQGFEPTGQGYVVFLSEDRGPGERPGGRTSGTPFSSETRRLAEATAALGWREPVSSRTASGGAPELRACALSPSPRRPCGRVHAAFAAPGP
eukprot:bmy_09125T0